MAEINKAGYLSGHQDALRRGLAADEIVEAAAFPEQNPSPVFRAGGDGRLQYANRASAGLLAEWGVAGRGALLPELWRQRVAATLESNAQARWDAVCGAQVFQLNLVPIREGGYVNIYGSDVTELRRAREAVERRSAAEQAALVAELTAGREQLAALSQRLVATHEAERTYVADQLYNQAGQVLAALRMQLARLGRDHAAAQLPVIEATLDEAIRELHALATQLRPFTLDRGTLASALRSYSTEFAAARNLKVVFDMANADGVRPPAAVATALFRATQEGLANIARHAKAREVRLGVRSEGSALVVTISDDGVGYDLNSVGDGLGLASMRERLRSVGGQVAVSSGPGGSTLTFVAPLAAEALPA
jgi:signal transduction histidine kinase